MVYVAKIGGSLLNYPNELRRLCRHLKGLAGEFEILVTPGGGVFADSVRAVYSKFNLPEDVAHSMAVLAMDQYGMLLNSLFEGGSTPITDLRGAVTCFKKGLTPILLASHMMSGDSHLPRSWNVTSDSIAAYVAVLIGAEGVVLIKSVDGVEMPTEDNPSPIFEKVSADQLLSLSLTCVDRYLPRVLRTGRMRCFVVNGRFPERVEDILRGRETVCTEITYS